MEIKDLNPEFFLLKKKKTKSIYINRCKNFVNFAKKKKTNFFLFYTPIFIKHSYQFVYSTHLFNKIFNFTLLSKTLSQTHHNPSHHQRSIHTKGGARIFCLKGLNFGINILVSSQDKPSYTCIIIHTQI